MHGGGRIAAVAPGAAAHDPAIGVEGGGGGGATAAAAAAAAVAAVAVCGALVCGLATLSVTSANNASHGSDFRSLTSGHAGLNMWRNGTG